MLERKREARKMVRIKQVVNILDAAGNKKVITRELVKEENAAMMIIKGDPTWHYVNNAKEKRITEPKKVKQEINKLPAFTDPLMGTDKPPVDATKIADLMNLIRTTEDGEKLRELQKDPRPKIQAEVAKRAKALGINLNS